MNNDESSCENWDTNIEELFEMIQDSNKSDTDVNTNNTTDCLPLMCNSAQFDIDVRQKLHAYDKDKLNKEELYDYHSVIQNDSQYRKYNKLHCKLNTALLIHLLNNKITDKNSTQYYEALKQIKQKHIPDILTT